MRRALLPLLALALGLFPAGVARSDEPKPAGEAPEADRLTREEIEALRRRVPGYDVLERVVKDRVARNVVRYRKMTPEERAIVLERARRLDRAGAVARAQFPGRLEQWRNLSKDDVRRAREGGLLVRATATAILRSLPEAARRVVETLPDAERKALEMCVFSLWRERAVEALLARPLSEAPLGADAPEGLRRRFEEARAAMLAAGGERASLAARRRFARVLHEERVRARLRALHEARPGADGPSPVDRLAVELRADLPEAFDAVTAAIAEAASKGPEELLSLCEAQAPGRRARALFDVFRAVERGRAVLAAVGSEALARADALQATLLLALGVPPEQVTSFGALRTRPEREAALRQMESLRNLHRPK